MRRDLTDAKLLTRHIERGWRVVFLLGLIVLLANLVFWGHA